MKTGMKLAELLYRIQGELDERPEDSDLRVVFVTSMGSVFEPIEAAPSTDGELLIVNIAQAEDLR